MTNNIEGLSDADIRRQAAGLRLEGQLEATFALLTTLRERQSQEPNPSQQAIGRTLGELALVAFEMGKKLEARALVEDALRALRSALGPLNLTLAHRMREFASAAEKGGDSELANELRLRASEIAVPLDTTAVAPPNADDLRRSGNNSADLADFESAEKCLSQAVILYRGSSSKRVELTEALSELGEVYRRTARYDRAELVESEACAIVQDAPVPATAKAKVLSNYGLLKSEMGNFQAALSLGQEVIDIDRKHNPNSAGLGLSLFNQAALFHMCRT
jgi:tetratricopeptide (TPR) repeat protein